MSYKRYSPLQRTRILSEIEHQRSIGRPVHKACWSVGITETTYYKWRKMLLPELQAAR